MSDDTRRTERVAGLVRTHVTELIRRELGDVTLSELVVTSVEVSRDLSIAHILVRSLAKEDDLAGRRRLMGRLRKAAPRLRRALGPRIELRRVPELRFEFDTGADASARVAELLAEIAKEPKGRGE
ncbi:MAG TPA: 30S ribosome-binding factor RbfA [Polyangiaceae bacterium]